MPVPRPLSTVPSVLDNVIYNSNICSTVLMGVDAKIAKTSQHMTYAKPVVKL